MGWGIDGRLASQKDIVDYLDVVLEDGDYKFLPLALSDIACVRKTMTGAAKVAGVSRTNLYQSLSEDGHLAFEPISKIVQSLGYRLTLVPVSKPAVR